MDKKEAVSKTVVIVSLLITFTVSLLADIIPFHGKHTLEILDIYPNLFSPAGYTYYILGLIYLLLTIYAVYQLDVGKNNIYHMKPEAFSNIRILYTISLVLNSLWVFAWHYEFIALSVMLIVGILICMVIINQVLSSETLSRQEKLYIRLPFSVVFGWVTVAMVTNISVLSVSIRFRGFGIFDYVWIIIILVLTMVIVAYLTIKNKDIIYCLTVLWSYIGIWVKHVSITGYAGQYKEIIITLIGCITFFLALITYLFLHKRKHGI